MEFHDPNPARAVNHVPYDWSARGDFLASEEFTDLMGTYGTENMIEDIEEFLSEF